MANYHFSDKGILLDSEGQSPNSDSVAANCDLTELEGLLGAKKIHPGAKKVLQTAKKKIMAVSKAEEEPDSPSPPPPPPKPVVEPKPETPKGKKPITRPTAKSSMSG